MTELLIIIIFISASGLTERLNERSLEDCLGRQRAIAIYIVGGWEWSWFQHLQPGPERTQHILIRDIGFVGLPQMPWGDIRQVPAFFRHDFHENVADSIGISPSLALFVRQVAVSVV
jgi:hypothetical protein